MFVREAVKNYLADFVRFPKKPSAERGGTPPPLTDNPQKNGSKRAKISVFWPKKAVFSGFFS